MITHPDTDHAGCFVIFSRTTGIRLKKSARGNTFTRCRAPRSDVQLHSPFTLFRQSETGLLEFRHGRHVSFLNRERVDVRADRSCAVDLQLELNHLAKPVVIRGTGRRLRDDQIEIIVVVKPRLNTSRLQSG